MNKKILLVLLPLSLIGYGCTGGTSSTTDPISSNSSNTSESSDSSFESSSTYESSSSEESSSSSSSSADSSSVSTEESDGIVTIYAINDFHGQIERDSDTNGIVSLQGAIRSDVNYEESSLIISSGDMWQGGYISGYDKGASTTELMNLFPFSSMTLGNHEFDWGVEQIQLNQEVADFPFLCANLIEKATDKRPDWIHSHTVLEAEGHKIGVVGAIGIGLEGDIKTEMIQDYYFSSDMTLIQEAYDACINEGAESVVLSIHSGNTYFVTSVVQAEIGFVGIFGGHTHSFTLNNESAIPYVQGGSNSAGYSKMVIDINEDKVTHVSWTRVTEDYTEAAADAFEAAVLALIESRPPQAVGYMQGDWTRTQTANLVTKAMFETARKLRPNANYDETSLVAFHNQGGVRANFPSSDTTIEVTMADVQTVSPFDNKVLILPDRELTYSASSGNYSYPSRDIVNEMEGQVVDLVVIDYIVTSVGTFSSEGSEPIRGVGEEDYIIFDVVADYISENSSAENPLRASDFN